MTGTSKVLPTGQRTSLHVWTKKLQGTQGTLTKPQGPTKCHILALALALVLAVSPSGGKDLGLFVLDVSNYGL